MRAVVVILVIAVFFAACSKRAKEESAKECFPIIDKAVASLEKFGLKLDTTDLDSALTYYDDAVRCDSSSQNASSTAKLATIGRYRESITIIDNVFKVRDVPTSRDAHFLMIKSWLYAKVGEKDSSEFYFEMFQRIITPE